MTSRALVLGGGGPVGFGWEIGMLKGLADLGIRLADADLIVGTSAGAGVGSQLASGVSPEELYERQLQDVDSVTPAAKLTPDLEALGKVFELWTGGSAMTQKVRAAIGAIAVQAKTGPEQEWTSSFNDDLLGSSEWPEKRLVITAVDVRTGEFVSWDSSSAVPLPLAIAASCSQPSVSTVDATWMDDCARSSTLISRTATTAWSSSLQAAPWTRHMTTTPADS